MSPTRRRLAGATSLPSGRRSTCSSPGAGRRRGAPRGAHSASWRPGPRLTSGQLAVTVGSRVRGQGDPRHLCRDQDSGSLCPNQSGPDEETTEAEVPGPSAWTRDAEAPLAPGAAARARRAPRRAEPRQGEGGRSGTRGAPGSPRWGRLSGGCTALTSRTASPACQAGGKRGARHPVFASERREVPYAQGAVARCGPSSVLQVSGHRPGGRDASPWAGRSRH